MGRTCAYSACPRPMPLHLLPVLLYLQICLSLPVGLRSILNWCVQLRIACNGIIDTLGRVTFDGKVKHPFTAHPKADPITGRVCCSQTPRATLHLNVQLKDQLFNTLLP